MFITDVMSEIWNENYQQYNIELKKAIQYEVTDLKKLCKSDIDLLNEKVFVSKNHSLTIIETIGCQHQFKSNCISGCTFCDWDSARIPELARLKALQVKDKNVYSEIIRYSFEKIRGLSCEPSIIEQLSIHDALDKTQFPEDAFNKLFIDNSVYTSKPHVGIISARASSVTENSILQWKKLFKQGLTIGIGVEVGNEWLRNHWLNKNIYNYEIERAIKLIHDNGAKVCANILLGIPGISAYNSLDIFFDTCSYLIQHNVDFILISPLITKPKSLGNLLNSNQYNNDIPLSILLADAVNGIIEKFQEHISKFTFSPDNFESAIQMSHGEELIYLEQIYNSIDNMGKVYTTKQLNKFEKIYKEFKNSEYYTTYNQKSSSTTSIEENLKTSAITISNTLWKNNEKYNEFLKELEQFECEELKCKL